MHLSNVSFHMAPGHYDRSLVTIDRLMIRLVSIFFTDSLSAYTLHRFIQDKNIWITQLIQIITTPSTKRA